MLENAGGDAVEICVPPSASACRPCDAGIDCGSLALGCISLVDGHFCLPACDAAKVCPGGEVCESVADLAGRWCVPDGGVCADCWEADGDGFGLGTECAGTDCNELSIASHEGASELCNGQDDDCDLSTDEGFDLASDIDHCGACGSVCALDNAVAVYLGGACQLSDCDEGWADCDEESGDEPNGCETDLALPESYGVCDPEINAFGGCNTLSAEPTTRCGVCDSGETACAGP